MHDQICVFNKNLNICGHDLVVMISTSSLFISKSLRSIKKMSMHVPLKYTSFFMHELLVGVQSVINCSR